MHTSRRTACRMPHQCSHRYRLGPATTRVIRERVYRGPGSCRECWQNSFTAVFIHDGSFWKKWRNMCTNQCVSNLALLKLYIRVCGSHMHPGDGGGEGRFSPISFWGNHLRACSYLIHSDIWLFGSLSVLGTDSSLSFRGFSVIQFQRSVKMFGDTFGTPSCNSTYSLEAYQPYLSD